MSMMQPPTQDQPQQPDLSALLSQLGQGQMPPQGGEAPDSGDNWLADAINAVHDGMVAEHDPQIVSDLGDILNRLTTVQAKMSQTQGNGPVGS